MAVGLEKAWTRLSRLAAEKAGVELADKLLPPDTEGLAGLQAGYELGAGGAVLAEFYGLTNGLDLSGYLPDVLSDSSTMPLSILPVTDVLGMYEENRQEQEEMDEDELEDMDRWEAGWLPFAWDGATGYQCVDVADGRVVHYDLAAFTAQDCAPTLARWFEHVADKVEAGELKVFNI